MATGTQMIFCLGDKLISHPADLQSLPTEQLEIAWQEFALGPALPSDRCELERAVYKAMGEISAIEELPEPVVYTHTKAPSDQRVIEVLTSKNPFRRGSSVYYRWENAKPQTGETVGNLKQRGLTGGDINWCINRAKVLKIADLE